MPRRNRVALPEPQTAQLPPRGLPDRNGYIPAHLGAHCERCLLCHVRDGDPVPPELHAGARLGVVGEGPGGDEIQIGRPFVGESGKELRRTLGLLGVKPSDVSIFNAFACRPPENRIEQIEKRIARENKRAEAARARIRAGSNDPADLEEAARLPWLHPVDACRPRLLRELLDAGISDVVPMGAQALRAFTGERKSITEQRGGMMEGWMAALDGANPRFVEARGPFADRAPVDAAWRIRMLPTVHPAFILRARRWTRVYRSDIHRALRWFAGLNDWVPPLQKGGVGVKNTDGSFDIAPSADWLYDWLAAREMVAYDTETDGLEPMLARLRCVSLGDTDFGVVVPFLSTDGFTRFYTKAEEARVADVLRWWFTAKDKLKLGWNIIQYDSHVVRNHFGVEPGPPDTVVDGLTVHRVVDPELPHGLGFASSLYAQLSPAWKATRAGKEARSDAELYPYALLDGVQTARTIPPIVQHAAMRQQQRVLAVDRSMSYVAANLHRIGLYIDVQRRNEWETLLLRGGVDAAEQRKYEAAKAAGKDVKPPKVQRGALTGTLRRPSWIAEVRHYAGRRDFNPNSVPQVRELIYETFRLPIPLGSNGKPKVTKAGDPSTDDEAVRALLVHPLLPPVPRDCPSRQGRACRCCKPRRFLLALRRYREIMKLYGTYVKRLVPMNIAVEASVFDFENEAMPRPRDPDAVNREDSEADAYEEAEKAAAEHTKVKGYIWPDGRIRPVYNSHGTLVGRLACSAMNVLNLPSKLRDMIIPAPGHTFVGADSNQIHMRIAASRWRLQKYLEAFSLDADPHALTALIIFADEFRRASGFAPGRWERDFYIPSPGAKWDGEAKKQRALGKTVYYASLYAALVETVGRVVMAAEDADGNLMYANLKPDDIARMHADLMAGMPELAAGWAAEMQTYRDQGFLLEPVLGRRFDFLDGEDLNKIVNAPILGAEASLMNMATVRFTEALPWQHATIDNVLANRVGPEAGIGLVHQNYDSMCAEVPLTEGPRIAKLMQECMTMTDPSLPDVVFTAEAQVGPNLKDA